MAPSNETVVRFVALYANGFEASPSSLILGYGYQDKGGQSHRKLHALYQEFDSSNDIYAGYLCIEDGVVKVFSGGSMTMGIDDDSKLNAKLEQNLNEFQDTKQKVLEAVLQIMSGEIEHAKIKVGV
jgi:hypothetical protein